MVNRAQPLKKTVIEVKPRILKGYWTDEKGNKISQENLENTVYFHIETRGIPNGDVIKLQLFDQDTFFDDKKFDGKEKIENITINSNKGTIKLPLPIEWTEDLKNEEWELGITTVRIHYRKLYWKATYGNSIKNIAIKSYLKIFYSTRTLYVVGSNDSFRLPELYNMNGAELVYTVIEGVHDLAEDSIKAFADKHINRIALVKLEKGNMIDNRRKVHTDITARGTQRIVSARTCFTNEGVEIRTVQGRNFTLPDGTTTKGISQIDYFANYGSKVKLIRLLKHTGTIVNAFEFSNILLSAFKPLDHSKPLSIPIVTGNPLVDIAANVILNIFGMQVHVFCAEIDETLEMQKRKELEEAKKQGIESVGQLVKRWIASRWATTINGDLKPNRVEYNIMGISNETASKIIQGKVTKFQEEVYSIEISNKNPDIQILYRREKDPFKESERFVIETFFINI